MSHLGMERSVPVAYLDSWQPPPSGSTAASTASTAASLLGSRRASKQPAGAGLQFSRPSSMTSSSVPARPSRSADSAGRNGAGQADPVLGGSSLASRLRWSSQDVPDPLVGVDLSSHDGSAQPEPWSYSGTGSYPGPGSSGLSYMPVMMRQRGAQRPRTSGAGGGAVRQRSVGTGGGSDEAVSVPLLPGGPGGSTVPSTTNGSLPAAPTFNGVRWAWDTQGLLPTREWQSTALGGQAVSSSAHLDNPQTPQKLPEARDESKKDTPRTALCQGGLYVQEAPDDTITPPKSLSSASIARLQQQRRRQRDRDRYTATAPFAAEPNAPLWKDGSRYFNDRIASKTVEPLRSQGDLNSCKDALRELARERERRILERTRESARLLERLTAEGPRSGGRRAGQEEVGRRTSSEPLSSELPLREPLREIPPPSRSSARGMPQLPDTCSSISGLQVNAPSTTVPSMTAPSIIKEPLREFSVSGPRYGREAATQSTEELPASIRHALLFIQNILELPDSSRSPNAGRVLLPPPRTERRIVGSQPFPTLVLDLDETLVHCRRGGSSGSRQTITEPCKTDLVVQFDDQPGCGSVGFRPHVRRFLEIASRSFEVVVFTASQQSYADKVLNALDPAGSLIDHRLYRQHCTELRGAFFKELGLLGRPLQQCVLVDNSPISVACNPDHGILIRSWYGDPQDRELVDLVSILQEMQAPHHGVDCSRYLAQRYGLREFFQALREQVRR